tara:strand:- start:4698 stop:5519 length:822 start_codon:yes stop_codon:yes gene_type:complete
MSRHSFDPEIAEQVGVNAAVIYQNLHFWCEKNAANEKNIHDGRAWTYNSRSAFETLFPYLTSKQIRTALDRLIDAELVVTGVFNKDARDRTKWYAVPALDGMMQKPSEADTLAPEGQALPDSKPDINLPHNPQGECDLFKANDQEPEKQDLFDVFWKVYPKSVGKPAARKAWDKAIKTTNPSEIIEGAKRYAHWLANPKKGEFRPHPKHPQGWLNAGRWADKDIWEGFDAGPSWDALSESQRRMLERGQCPPSMMVDGKPNETAVALMSQVRR